MRLRNEMRELFLLYGSPGQWERLQAEIANERARQAEAIKEKIRKARLRKNIIIGTVAVLISIGILVLEILILTNRI